MDQSPRLNLQAAWSWFQGQDKTYSEVQSTTQCRNWGLHASRFDLIIVSFSSLGPDNRKWFGLFFDFLGLFLVVAVKKEGKGQ